MGFVILETEMQTPTKSVGAFKNNSGIILISVQIDRTQTRDGLEQTSAVIFFILLNG